MEALATFLAMLLILALIALGVVGAVAWTSAEYLKRALAQLAKEPDPDHQLAQTMHAAASRLHQLADERRTWEAAQRAEEDA